MCHSYNSLSYGRRFILSIALPIIFGLVGIIVFSISWMFVTTKVALQPAETFSYATEKTNLIIRARNLARTEEKYFSQLTLDMNLLTDYTEKAINNTIPITGFYESYNADIDIDSRVPPNFVNGKSFSYSTYYRHGLTTIDNVDHVNETSTVDNHFRIAHIANPGLAAIYVAFEDDFMRIYPYERLPQWKTISYVCAKTQNNVIGYRPTCRIWYVNSKQMPNNVLFSEPYIDASTGLVLISGSKGMFKDGSFVGAVGCDVSMTKLNDLVLNAKVATNGFSFMITQNLDTVIFPSGISGAQFSRDNGVLSIGQVFFADSIIAGNLFESTLENQFVSQYFGQFEFQRYGINWLATWSKINTTNYYHIMVMPMTDIQDTIIEIRTNTDNVAIIGTIVIVILSVIAFGVILYFLITIGNTVSSALDEWTDSLEKIGNGNTPDEGSGNYEFKEQGIVKSQLKNIFEVFQFAQIQNSAGNFEEAYVINCRIKKMLEDSGKFSAIPIVLNNMGNLMRKMRDKPDNFNHAKKFLLESIASSRKMIKDNADITDVVAMARLKKILAYRLNNLGLLYIDMEYWEDAKMALIEASDIHTEVDNGMGIVIANGNIGILYLKQGNMREAEKVLSSTYKKIVRRYEKAMSDLLEADNEENRYARSIAASQLQQSCINYATHLIQNKKDTDTDYAHDILLYAASDDLSTTMSHQMRRVITQHLITTSTRKGLTDMTSKLNDWAGLNQDYYILLDISGSMACEESVTETVREGTTTRTQCVRKSRLEIAQDALKYVVKEFIKPSYKLGLVAFDHELHPILCDSSDRTKKIDHMISVNDSTRDELFSTIDTITTEGGTAMRNAIYTMSSQFPVKSTAKKWMIVITDGADTYSDTRPPYITQKRIINHLKQHKDIGLIIIAAGSGIDKRNLALNKELCNTSSKSHFIRSSDFGKLKSALSEAMQYIQAGFEVMENLG